MKTGLSILKSTPVKKLMGQLERLALKEVLVGIPGDSSERRDASGGTSPINNAALGYIHENGAPDANIPARPFLVPGLREDKVKLAALLKRAAMLAAAGKPKQAEKVLHAAGLSAVAAVKKKMRTGPFAPLKPSTLAARRRRKITRTMPLIDTANLMNHIAYVLK